ncbi:MAG: NfeD family protein [Rhodothermales bacterium]|nr:NfeD family protein [Rhodothermales bacterium]
MELFTPILLILAGLGLIAVEVYIVPGFNVVGVLGGLAIVAGVVYAFAVAGLAGGIGAAIGAGIAGGGMFYLMWQSGAWERFVLAADLRRDADADERESDARSRYLGKSGVAATPLRPGGIAEIEGERVEVQTEGEFIAAGSAVRVVAMDRRRFFVRLEDQPGPAAEPATVRPDVERGR